MKVGPCISALAGSSDQNASKTFLPRDRGGERQRAAGQRLGQRHDIRHDAGLLEREHRAGAAEAGEDLVEDQQKLVTVCQRAQSLEHARIVKAHAAGALHQRLDDDGGDLLGSLGQHRLERRRARVVDRKIDDDLLRQQAAEGGVEAAFRVGNRHGAGGVAVIAALERNDAAAAADAAIAPVLHRHFQGDFDGDRAGIAEEHAVKIAPAPASP